MLLFGLLFAGFGLVLAYAAIRLRVEGNPIVDQINAVLPQTQCGQCSYPGCRPYAQAIASDVADINQCPPGGAEGIKVLADLLGVEAKPLNVENGIAKPKSLAVIIEQECIGCIKCIEACPVDAILGAAKQMHTVIASECTGCELCVDPCPTDCIVMVPIAQKIAHEVSEINPHQACIRCGLCVSACPVNLLPQQLYWHSRAENFDQLNNYRLLDCIECGRCERVCPSNIPLVQYYRASKSKIQLNNQEAEQAVLAKRRYDDQVNRKQQQKDQSAERMRKKIAAIKTKLEQH